MLNRSDVEDLIPHKGTMCLLDRVLSWDALHISLATQTHSDANNPLRDSTGLRGLRAIHLCEYGAQAMAVHGALLARLHGQSTEITPGMLASLRAVKLRCDFIHDLPSELIVHAECLHASDALLQYGFRVLHQESLVAEGRAAVVLRH